MKKKVVKRAPKKRYVIVRTYSAGVFAGTLESRKGREVVLTDGESGTGRARRVCPNWLWRARVIPPGANSLARLIAWNCWK